MFREELEESQYGQSEVSLKVRRTGTMDRERIGGLVSVGRERESTGEWIF